MLIELVERVDAAASELLACLKRGEASSEDLLGVLSGTRAVRGKLDTVQALAAASVAGSRSHRDGGAHVLAENTGMSRRDARSQVRIITAIDAMPTVRDAVEEGRMSVANAGRLADALDETSVAEIESDEELLAKAESFSPERFAKEAKRWTAERRADGGEAEYRRLRARRAVRLWDGDDGMVHLYGQFDPVTGRRIRSRLNKEAHRLLDADRRQARAGGEERSVLDADTTHVRAGGGTRSLKQGMADALDNMTRGTAGGGKPFVDIALVARLDSGTEKLMVSTADGDPLPAAVIERLAGESSWFGLVLSAKGVPMWKGRNIRRATESQFQALTALYGGCAGCSEPDENRLHAHHVNPFARGGGTDLDNLMPLCWSCHDNIHDHKWQVVAAGDGKHTIRPPATAHYGPARLPDTAPLFGPPEQVADAAPRPAVGFGRRDDASTWSGGDEERGGNSRSGGGSTAGPAGPRTARAAPESVSAAGSANATRAGPAGLQAARAALRRARAARHDAQAAHA